MPNLIKKSWTVSIMTPVKLMHTLFFPFAECEDRDDQEIYTETAAAIN